MRFAVQTACLALLMTSAVAAHHGSAGYHVDREVSVSGTIASFRWINPHIRIVLTVTDPAGTRTRLDCEGPPLSWAADRGWSEKTLAEGERVTVVMYPAKQEGRGGLVKRIERPGGETLVVSRPWLDGR